MSTINDGIRFVNSTIDTCTDYVKENSIQIILILGIVYYLRNHAGKAAAPGHTLKEGNGSNKAVGNRDQELLLVRKRQQEIADERAKQAAILRKEKEHKERERKNNSARKSNKTTPGDKLGGASDIQACDYNPMQPWSSSSNGYRPARRTVRRG